jgi:hypothetical protein
MQIQLAQDLAILQMENAQSFPLHHQEAICRRALRLAQQALQPYRR